MRYILIILLNLLTNIAFSQITVTGIVIDEEGLPLLGINVTEKGSDNYALTDFDGSYSITVKDSTAILIFSFMGMITREITVDDQTVIDTFLKGAAIYEAWDQKLRFFLKSGLIENPFGGQFEFAIPTFINALSLYGNCSYQTNFKENRSFDAGLQLNGVRLFYSDGLYFGVGIQSYYRNILSNNDISIEAYSIETRWWSWLPFDLLVGYSQLDFKQNSQNDDYSRAGIILGTEFSIRKPFEVSIIGKVSVCKNLVEYQAEIRKEFGKHRRIHSFVEYYNIDSYTELSLGIGIEFTYFFKYQNNEY